MLLVYYCLSFNYEKMFTIALLSNTVCSDVEDSKNCRINLDWMEDVSFTYKAWFLYRRVMTRPSNCIGNATENLMIYGNTSFVISQTVQ